MDGEESKPNCLKINCTSFHIKQHTVKVVYMLFKKEKFGKAFTTNDLKILFWTSTLYDSDFRVYHRYVTYELGASWTHDDLALTREGGAIWTTARWQKILQSLSFFMCKRGTLPWNAMKWKESKANLENRSQCFNSTKYPEVIQDIISDGR